MSFRRAVTLAAALIFGYSSNSAANDYLIFGGPDHDQYLGCLSCSEFSSESVFNSISPYGFDNELGVWSSLRPFRSTISGASACSQFAAKPPIVVDREGNFYWSLTINQFAPRSACGIYGNSQLCTALKAMCDR
jgi:hypothetical protein